MKYIVVLGDGMADYAVPELNGRTPLDVAKHPTMDYIAQRGEFGLVKTIPDNMPPGSDTANLAVFGYDPAACYSGRSPLEAASLGIDLAPDDVTYRCNLVTLADCDDINDSVMLDYSAGEIGSDEASELVQALNDALSDATASLHPGFSYRHCLVLHHAQIGAILTPPHDISARSTHGCLPRGENAELLDCWMRVSHTLLADHPVNRARVAAGKNPANCVWFWGEGRRPALTSFHEKTGLNGAVVSAVDLIQGIGVTAGMRIMRVNGATGTYTTDYAGKAQAALDALHSGCDYVYVHVEGPDECGHHHQVDEKVYAIEQIDEKILSPIMYALGEAGEAFTILLLPDHPTPLTRMTHVSDPVPYVLYRCGGDVQHEGVRYCEKDAAATGMYLPDGYRLIDRMLGR